MCRQYHTNEVNHWDENLSKITAEKEKSVVRHSFLEQN